MSGGTDRIFTEPPHAIRGATRADQAWIDETIEAGKTCCRWAVKPRPLELDRPAAVLPAPKPTKPHWWQKLKRKPKAPTS